MLYLCILFSRSRFRDVVTVQAFKLFWRSGSLFLVCVVPPPRNSIAFLGLGKVRSRTSDSFHRVEASTSGPFDKLMLRPKNKEYQRKRYPTRRRWLHNLVVLLLVPACAVHRILWVRVRAVAQVSVRSVIASLTCFKLLQLSFSQLELQVSNSLQILFTCFLALGSSALMCP